MAFKMTMPYEWQVGWRYTRAGRATRRNGFISFISGVSMLGIALGVAALIIVLSVMNGFQKEVRDRMLGVVSHIEIFAPGGAALPDVDRTLAEAQPSALQNANGIKRCMGRLSGKWSGYVPAVSAEESAMPQ